MGLYEEMKSVWCRLVIGVILIGLATWIIVWNEQIVIKTAKSLTAVFKDLRVIDDNRLVDPNNEGSLVYITGEIHVDEPLTEPEYGISVPAVCLKRRVQMYQWVEEEDTSIEFSDKSTYFPEGQFVYKTEWRDKLIDSSTFHDVQDGHVNPDKFLLTSQQYISDVVRIGSYILSPNIKKKFNDFVLITSDERPERRDIKLHAGLYYHAADVWNPEVGNIRVQFSFAGMAGDPISIIAKQSGNELGKEGTILLSKGRSLPDSMIKDQQYKNVWTSRFYRSIGWLFLYISASFISILTRSLSSRYREIYNVIVLDGILSPNISFASIFFTLIISYIWYLYDPSIGLCINIAFLLPWFIYAFYKKCKHMKKRRE